MADVNGNKNDTRTANGNVRRARANTTGSIENIHLLRNQHQRSKKQRYIGDGPETDEEKMAASKRMNQQMIVYLFVCAAIIGSFTLGVFGFSFTWVLGVLAATFWIWQRKTTKLLEQALREKEIIIHRRRNLRQSETAEWFNFVINRWWVFSATAISDVIKKNLEPLLQDIKPPILESIEVLTFSIGEKTPFVKYATAYEYVDGGKRPMSFSSVVQPPEGLTQAQFYQVVLELDTALHCEDFSMIFRTRLGGKRMGMNLDVAVEQLNIAGKLQLILHMDMDRAFPHISSVTISFVEKPEVWFSLRVLKAVQMMEIPLIKNWIHSVVMGGLTEALVDPGKMDIKFERTGPTNIPETGKSRQKAAGVLTVTIDGEYIRGSTFVEDTRYCQVRVGAQKRHTQHLQAVDDWQETLSFLVEDLSTDKLSIKCKSKFLLTLTTLANFEICLSDYPLQHQPSAKVTLESKLSKSKFGGATIKLNVTMVYTPLPQIEAALESGGMPANPLGYIVPSHQAPSVAESVSGVMYICVHNAIGLLGLDRNGFSDPYCVIYCNGKKIKTTHYVEKTKNPRWDVSTEVIVGDCTRTILYFILYDWDGASPSEDDFLGSAHFILPKDERSVIRRSLTLGYNLLNVGQVENNKLGNVTVSCIFRPVPDVQLGEKSNPIRNPFTDHPTTYKSKSFISQAKDSSENNSKDKQKLGPKRSSAVKNILAMGGGIVELNIYQAKDLVSADSNGFSDPYCDVKVGGERKFTTSTKKKTLSPVWDEWVTLPIPKSDETLELTVWDKDAFFQKDFLGVVTFTLDDLKQYSVDNKAQSWFELQRTNHGWIQVFFKVISEDLKPEEGDTFSPVVEDPLPYKSSKEPISPNTRAGSAPPDLQNSTPTTVPSGETQNTTSGGEVLTNGNSSPNETRSTKKEDEEMKEPPPSSETRNLNPVTPTSQHITSSSTPSTPIVRHSSSSEYHQQRPPPSPAISTASDVVHRHRNTSLNIPGGRSISQANSMSSIAPGERYYWVQGQLLRIQGLRAPNSSVYCKLRLDNRRLNQREKKFSHGTVISKTSNVSTGSNQANFNHNFDVDYGHGVAKEALLIFDVKTSHKEHLATKGYSLQDLLQDEQEVTRWVQLEHGIELEVFISHGNHHSSLANTERKRSRTSLFDSFRSKNRNKQKNQ